MVLFGSCSRGENTENSDIDLFVMTHGTPEAIHDAVKKSAKHLKLQLVIRNPQEYAGMQAQERLFVSEIERGITLWEK
ncbi:MAG: nucleotidyltransferase domain-containing protein [Candidatus Omnitrophica bacterium]|nr:nucleotidyltransferase domain-containing protein [Candidatus Omnitrophota bacterium]